MIIAGRDVVSVLVEKGCRNLFHVNTVKTSLTYIQQGGLLSRGAVVNMGLAQTWQKSDEQDQDVGVWNDIFFDAVDIHARIRSFNYYGPVMFVYNLDVLLENDIQIKVIKTNPSKWDDSTSLAERYYQNKDDLRSNYVLGRFDTMFTMVDQFEPLHFVPHLVNITVDQGGVVDQSLNLGDNAFSLLRNHANKYCPDIVDKIQMRSCPDNCKCTEGYKAMYGPRLRRVFCL